MAIIPEAAHPYGRTYPKGFFRPEDQSQRKPGTRENYGHVSALGGAPGRISGEILYDKDTNAWIINNKSGRYTKHNMDRTPEQLVNAAKLIREVVDPGKTPGARWSSSSNTAPRTCASQLMKNPQLQYDDPAKKSAPAPDRDGRRRLDLQAGRRCRRWRSPRPAAAPAAPKRAPAAPTPGRRHATKAKKAKAAHNDDPS